MLSRLSAIRRLPHLPRTFAVRYYSNGRSEGSIAQSSDFGKIERAIEGQYYHKRDEERIRKLVDDIKAKQAELESLVDKESSVDQESAQKEGKGLGKETKE